MMDLPPIAPPFPPQSPCMSPLHPMYPQQRMAGIEHVHSNDVLCGRGVTTNRHKGNESFRSLVNLNKELYVTSTKKEKMMISRSIVEHVRTLEPPGRFLEKDLSTGLWFDIGDKKATEKTSQALRDGAACLRKQLSEDLSDPDFLNAVFEEKETLPPPSKGSAVKKGKDGKDKKAPAKGHRRTFSNPTTSGPFKLTAVVKKQRSWDVPSSPVRTDSAGNAKPRASSPRVIVPRSPVSPRSPGLAASSGSVHHKRHSTGSLCSPRREPTSPRLPTSGPRKHLPVTLPPRSYRSHSEVRESHSFGESNVSHATIDPHQPSGYNGMMRQHRPAYMGTPPRSPRSSTPRQGGPFLSPRTGNYHPHSPGSHPGWSPPPHLWKSLSPHSFRHPSDGHNLSPRGHPASPRGYRYHSEGSHSHPPSPVSSDHGLPPRPSSPHDSYNESRSIVNLSVPGLGPDPGPYRSGMLPRMSPLRPTSRHHTSGSSNGASLPTSSTHRHSFIPPLPPAPRRDLSPDDTRVTHHRVHAHRQVASPVTSGGENYSQSEEEARPMQEDEKCEDERRVHSQVTPSPPSARRMGSSGSHGSHASAVKEEPNPSPSPCEQKQSDQSDFPNNDDTFFSPLPFKPSKYEFDDPALLMDLPENLMSLPISPLDIMDD